MSLEMRELSNAEIDTVSGAAPPPPGAFVNLVLVGANLPSPAVFPVPAQAVPILTSAELHTVLAAAGLSISQLG